MSTAPNKNHQWVAAFGYPRRLVLLAPGQTGLFHVRPVHGASLAQARNTLGGVCKAWVAHNTDWHKDFGRGAVPADCLIHRPHPDGLLVGRRPLITEPPLDFDRAPDYVWDFTPPPRRLSFAERLEQMRKERGLD